MLLIRNADSILTLDAHRRILEGHSMLIDGAVIKDIGPAAEMDRKHLAASRSLGSVLEAPSLPFASATSSRLPPPRSPITPDASGMPQITP